MWSSVNNVRLHFRQHKVSVLLSSHCLRLASAIYTWCGHTGVARYRLRRRMALDCEVTKPGACWTVRLVIWCAFCYQTATLKYRVHSGIMAGCGVCLERCVVVLVTQIKTNISRFDPHLQCCFNVYTTRCLSIGAYFCSVTIPSKSSHPADSCLTSHVVKSCLVSFFVHCGASLPNAILRLLVVSRRFTIILCKYLRDHILTLTRVWRFSQGSPQGQTLECSSWTTR